MTPIEKGISMIELRPMTRDNFYTVVKLAVREDQTGFVASNAFSIAEASVHEGWEPLAIYAGEEPVGLTLWGSDHAEPDPEWWIVRLMIDQAHQGRGYGRATLIALLARIQERVNPPAIFLSFEPENHGAEALYRSLGFQPTGRVESGELVFKLDLG